MLAAESLSGAGVRIGIVVDRTRGYPAEVKIDGEAYQDHDDERDRRPQPGTFVHAGHYTPRNLSAQRMVDTRYIALAYTLSHG